MNPYPLILASNNEINVLHLQVLHNNGDQLTDRPQGLYVDLAYFLKWSKIHMPSIGILGNYMAFEKLRVKTPDGTSAEFWDTLMKWSEITLIEMTKRIRSIKIEGPNFSSAFFKFCEFVFH